MLVIQYECKTAETFWLGQWIPMGYLNLLRKGPDSACGRCSFTRENGNVSLYWSGMERHILARQTGDDTWENDRYKSSPLFGTDHLTNMTRGKTQDLHCLGLTTWKTENKPQAVCCIGLATWLKLSVVLGLATWKKDGKPQVSPLYRTYYLTQAFRCLGLTTWKKNTKK